MEIVYFVTFVVVCAIVVMWAVGQSRRAPNKSRGSKAGARKSSPASPLQTPSDYTLSRPDQVWQTRRQSATTGVARTNTFVARSLGQDPEYDGYSRRDRHHIRDRNAKIHEKTEVRESRAGGGEFKRSRAGG